MSFVFPSWSTAFSSDFYDDAKAMLETALNKVSTCTQTRADVVG